MKNSVNFIFGSDLNTAEKYIYYRIMKSRYNIMEFIFSAREI